MWILSIIGFLAFLFNYFFLIFFFVSILADSNRVPYDLAECESELVAGFITEYSTIYFSLVCLFFYLIPLNTLLWSLFKAIVLNDIKSIIALSTISQISYMFIALLINPILCFYHIIIHSLFKSILSLLAGSLIHI